MKHTINQKESHGGHRNSLSKIINFQKYYNSRQTQMSNSLHSYQSNHGEGGASLSAILTVSLLLLWSIAAFWFFTSTQPAPAEVEESAPVQSVEYRYMDGVDEKTGV